MIEWFTSALLYNSMHDVAYQEIMVYAHIMALQVFSFYIPINADKVYN